MNRRKLTVRETSVSELIREGRTNAEIAEALGVSVATVKRHLNNIMIKWDCANRTQVAVRAILRDSVAEAAGASGVLRAAARRPAPAAPAPSAPAPPKAS